MCVIATPDGGKFLDAGNLAGLTRHPVRVRYKRPDEPDVLPPPNALVVAPATFNTVNKWAQGISDTLALGLLNEAVGLRLPIVAVPWPNAALAAHPVFARSVAALREWGITVILDPPACRSPRPGTRRVPVGRTTRRPAQPARGTDRTTGQLAACRPHHLADLAGTRSMESWLGSFLPGRGTSVGRWPLTRRFHRRKRGHDRLPEDLKRDQRWPARRITMAFARRFACALSLRVLDGAVETPPRLPRSSVKADFRPRVSPRFLREDARWQQSAEIAQVAISDTGVQMIILGLVILIVGFLLKIAILWTIGIVILVIGLILLLLGAIGHEVGGRRHYW